MAVDQVHEISMKFSINVIWPLFICLNHNDKVGLPAFTSITITHAPLYLLQTGEIKIFKKVLHCNCFSIQLITILFSFGLKFIHLVTNKTRLKIKIDKFSFFG